jgi:hypothetical protein
MYWGGLKNALNPSSQGNEAQSPLSQLTGISMSAGPRAVLGSQQRDWNEDRQTLPRARWKTARGTVAATFFEPEVKKNLVEISSFV